MSDLQAHEDFVRCNLEDRVAARALVDHYQDDAGMTRRAALRVVAALRKSRRDASEEGQAAELMKPDSRYRPLLSTHIRAEVETMDAIGATVLIVAGSRPPKFRPPKQGSRGHYWRTGTIVVGARWILVCWRTRLLREPKPK